MFHFYNTKSNSVFSNPFAKIPSFFVKMQNNTLIQSQIAYFFPNNSCNFIYFCKKEYRHTNNLNNRFMSLSAFFVKTSPDSKHVKFHSWWCIRMHEYLKKTIF